MTRLHRLLEDFSPNYQPFHTHTLLLPSPIVQRERETTESHKKFLKLLIYNIYEDLIIYTWRSSPNKEAVNW